jgi:large subunit ribosomal protein L10
MSEATQRISPARVEKAKDVAVLKGTFQKATSMVVLGYKGMDVPAVTELRARFRKVGVEYLVIKNTLFLQAIKGSAIDGNQTFEKALTGMTGIAFSFEDPSIAAKVVKEFRKDEKHQKLEVKCGVLDASVMGGAEVEATLATMPGKDELRAMLLAQLQAPSQKLVQQLQAAGQNLVYALEAHRKQLAGE